MKRRHFFPACASLLGWPPAFAAPAGRADFHWIDRVLQERVQRGYFDGMALAIGRGPRLLHSAHVGKASPHRVLHVASTGKWVAAAVVAALVDGGLLDWEDPVRKFLPQFEGAMGRARLRELLSHIAGYPDYQPEGQRRDDYSTLSEAVAHIQVLAPLAEPGARFQYGGLAMQVAGRMAELAGGADFDTLFRRRLAEPLGMSLSGFSPVSREPGFNPMLGGAFYTCSQDYARFMMMLAGDGRFKGRKVLSSAAIRAMQTDQVRGAAVAAEEYVQLARQDLRDDIYGLGEWREEVDPAGRATLLSSPGWAGAYAWLDKRADLWGVVIAKANVDVARADGYSTFLGSSIYAPMARAAVAESNAGVRRHAIRVNAVTRLYVEEFGEGEPLVLLHGHSFDRRQWDPQLSAFAAHYRVIRYDLRGYGRSDDPVEGDEFLHLEDLRAVLDALGIHRAHLVGLSLGGLVVTDFLARYPDRVTSAVMAGGELYDAPGPDSPWTPAELAQRRRAISQSRETGIQVMKRRWLEELIKGSGSQRERLRRPLWQMIDEWRAWQLTHAEPRLLLGRMAPAALAAARPSAPVLLIRGDRERIVDKITAWLPQASKVVVADCGHVSSMEQPVEFNAAVLQFVRAASAPRTR